MRETRGFFWVVVALLRMWLPPMNLGHWPGDAHKGRTQPRSEP